MSTPNKTILVVGLGRFGPPNTVNDARAKVQSQLQKAREAGYDTTELQLDPENKAESLEAVREALKLKSFDAMVIGYGLRGFKENTVLFEEVVNVAGS